MDGASQVPGGKFVDAAHIHQYIGRGDGLFGVGQGHLTHAGFGGGDQVMGCFQSCSP